MVNKKARKEIFGYILIAIFNYPILFGLLYVFKNNFKFQDQLCFFLSYAIAYVIAYKLQTILFKSGHKNIIAGKYFLQIIIFFTLGNALFFLMNSSFKINYMVSTVIIILLLFPLRYLFSKFFVFTNRSNNNLHNESGRI